MPNETYSPKIAKFSAFTLSAALALALAGPTIAQPPESLVREGRMIPPARLACPRDQLTSYTGEAIEFTREPGVTAIIIHTDWDTTETVLIKHPGTNNPSARFLVGGRPFSHDDWALIESAHGELREGLRATAWVCGDGVTPVVVDWQLPPD